MKMLHECIIIKNDGFIDDDDDILCVVSTLIEVYYSLLYS